jgi:probable rRNA maturation factor
MTGSKRIFFHTHLISYRINERAELRRVLERLFANEKKSPSRVDYIFSTDDYLLELNQSHLGHDYFTDVITFDYTDPKSDDGIVGEVYISVHRIRENAGRYKVSVTDESRRIMIHGALHLCGYKDNTSAARARMSSKEDYYLSLF